MSIELKPVADPKSGEVQLIDIFIDGQWIGSRRTEEQCRQGVRNWEARNAR